MAAGKSDKPYLFWKSPNLFEAFMLFKKECEIYFVTKNIKEEKQVRHILAFTCAEGVRRFNSWGLSEADKKKPDKVWERFRQSIVNPAENFRFARHLLRKYRQEEKESIDDFVSRCKTQASKCDFPKHTTELEERVIEQMIDGARHTKIRRELLSQPKELTLAQALSIARKLEASLAHLQLFECLKGPANTSYDNGGRKSSCFKCGGDHARNPTACPARDATCGGCGKRGHWKKACKSKNQADPQAGTSSSSSRRGTESYEERSSNSSKSGTKNRNSNFSAFKPDIPMDVTDYSDPTSYEYYDLMDSSDFTDPDIVSFEDPYDCTEDPYDFMEPSSYSDYYDTADAFD